MTHGLDDDQVPTFLPRSFRRLAVPVPPMLEAAVGYRPLDPGGARFVALWWGGDDCCWHDGRAASIGGRWGWLAFVRHPAVRFAAGDLDLGSEEAEARQWLVLDRRERALYAADAGEAAGWLPRQWPAEPPAEVLPEVREQLAFAVRHLCVAPDPAAVNAEVTAARAAERRLVEWLDAAPHPAAAGRRRARLDRLARAGKAGSPVTDAEGL
jgi:hypothetical protein